MKRVGGGGVVSIVKLGKKGELGGHTPRLIEKGNIFSKGGGGGEPPEPPTYGHGQKGLQIRVHPSCMLTSGDVTLEMDMWYSLLFHCYN